MYQTSIISPAYDVLLKLLRIALGTEPLDAQGQPKEPFPAEVNWPEVIRLSYKQKVSSLAVDGLKASGYDPYRGLTDQKAESLKQLMDAWQNDVVTAEESYDYYLMVLNTLCQIFISNGLTPIILKGYGLSLDYPIPSHRGAGDIDVFLIDSKGRPAAEKGVALVENTLGIKTTKVPHDYEFEFKGIEVELHYEMTSPYWDTKRENYIVTRLTELLLEHYIPCPGIDGACIPDATFNAIYLTRHMFGHFYQVMSNFRQYTDWLTFLSKHSMEIDWQVVNIELQTSGLKPFFNGVQTMLNRWLTLDGYLCPIASSSPITEKLTLKDMQGVIPYGRHLHQRFRHFYSNREKLAFVSGKSWIYHLARSITTTIKQRLKLK